MRPTKQKEFAITVKRKLLDRGWTVAELARRLSPERSREAVSRAIHKGHFPRIKAEIVRVLGL